MLAYSTVVVSSRIREIFGFRLLAKIETLKSFEIFMENDKGAKLMLHLP